MEHILIVYYSRKGQNYWAGSIRNLEKGNMEIVAEMIQEAVGGDLFEVDTVKPYSTDYTACTQEAQAELRANARPGLPVAARPCTQIGFPRPGTAMWLKSTRSTAEWFTRWAVVRSSPPGMNVAA